MIPPRLNFALLRWWHAWLAGAFVVAWITADEDTYAMHVFAGYAVLAALALRLAAGVLAAKGSPWRLPRPKLAWRQGRGRHPLLAWFAAALLITIAAAGLSGWIADAHPWMEHPHEALANLSLWVIGGHVVFVLALFGGKSLRSRLSRPFPVKPSSLCKENTP